MGQQIGSSADSAVTSESNGVCEKFFGAHENRKSLRLSELNAKLLEVTQVSATVLNPDDVGMFAEFGHEVEAEDCADAGRHIVEQQREWGFVGEATKPVGKSGRWNIEVERGGSYDCGGAGTVSMNSEQERFGVAGVGDTAEHRDTAVHDFADTIDDFVSLSIAERRAFPGCSQSEDASHTAFQQMFDDLRHGGRIEKSIGGER